MINAKVIIDILKSHRFAIGNEKVTQNRIWALLNRYNKVMMQNIDMTCAKEYRLDDKNIIDFYFLAHHIGIEVKIGGSAKDIYRQLERYTAFDQIKEIILLTNRTMGLPATINNKPVYVLNLSKAWL